MKEKIENLIQWIAEIAFWVVAITIIVMITGPWLVAGLRALGIGTK